MFEPIQLLKVCVYIITRLGLQNYVNESFTECAFFLEALEQFKFFQVGGASMRMSSTRLCREIYFTSGMYLCFLTAPLAGKSLQLTSVD